MQVPYYFSIVQFLQNEIVTLLSFTNTIVSYNIIVLVQFNNTIISFLRKLYPFESSLLSLLSAIIWWTIDIFFYFFVSISI